MSGAVVNGNSQHRRRKLWLLLPLPPPPRHQHHHQLPKNNHHRRRHHPQRLKPRSRQQTTPWSNHHRHHHNTKGQPHGIRRLLNYGHPQQAMGTMMWLWSQLPMQLLMYTAVAARKKKTTTSSPPQEPSNQVPRHHRQLHWGKRLRSVCCIFGRWAIYCKRKRCRIISLTTTLF